MGKGDDPNCRTDGAAVRRSLQEEVAALKEEAQINKAAILRLRDMIQSSGRADLEAEVAHLSARLQELEEEREPGFFTRMYRKVMKDKGVYFGGAIAAAGLMAANPLLMAVGGVAFGLNKLRRKKEAQDFEAEYLALRGGEAVVPIQEMRNFNNLSPDEKEKIIKAMRHNYQTGGGAVSSPLGYGASPTPGPSPSTPDPSPNPPNPSSGVRSEETADGHYQEDYQEEEMDSEEYNSEMAKAESIRKEALDSLDKEILDDLQRERTEAGKNFGEAPHDLAIEARKIMLISRSVAVSGDPREDEIREAVAQLEAENVLASRGKEFEEESKAITSLEKDLQKEHNAESRKEEKRIKELEAIQKNLIESVQSMEAEGILTPESSARAKAQFDNLEGEKSAIREGQKERAMRIESYIQKAKADLRSERESSYSPYLGQIGNLINVSLDSAGHASCYRCGTRPTTVRQCCSKCGMPFVAPPEMAHLIGVGEEGLREERNAPYLKTLEKYEGDQDKREEKWKIWGEGNLAVEKEEGLEEKPKSGSGKKRTRRKDKKTSSAKETSSANKTATKEESQDGGSSTSFAEAEERLQPDGEYDREKYLEDQRALRSGDNPERRLFVQQIGPHKVAKSAAKFAEAQGEPFTPDPDMIMPQTTAMISGVQGWEWNTSSADVRVGDRVFINSSGGNIIGYYDVEDHFRVDIPDDPESEEFEEEFDRVVDETWERIRGDMNEGKYYTKAALRGELMQRALSPKSGKTLYFSKVGNPQSINNYKDPDLRVQKKGAKADSIVVRGTACLNDDSLESGMLKRKGKEPQGLYEANSERTEKLARAGEENDARLVEENGGRYPNSQKTKSKKETAKASSSKASSSKEKTQKKATKANSTRDKKTSSKSASDTASRRKQIARAKAAWIQIKLLKKDNPAVTKEEILKKVKQLDGNPDTLAWIMEKANRDSIGIR